MTISQKNSVVDNGDRVRLSGKASWIKWSHGDLFVNITFKEHPIFDRDGSNLLCEVPIDFPIGCSWTIKVPTIDGKVTLKIPNETQTGKMFRLRGKRSQIRQRRGYCRI